MQTAHLLAKLSPYWSGYVLSFGKKARPVYSNAAGIRLLATCFLLEALIRPSLRAALPGLVLSDEIWRGLALVSVALVLAVGLTRFWIRISFTAIGLYRWRQWASAEKWFFPQIVAVSLVAFMVTQWENLCAVPQQPAWIRIGVVIFVWQTIWGFYQEYVYRGLLQTELVRRWGAAVGILAGNLLFTFGPLHAYHFSSARDDPGHLWIFAAIFAIGLYFGVLFQRSGNLWMIGVLHGLGDFFIDGVAMMNKPL
jgi:membrane protease YdiL (CAAX protease family)